VKFRMQNWSSHSSGHAFFFPRITTSTWNFCAYMSKE
jgi:hypothetical protein